MPDRRAQPAGRVYWGCTTFGCDVGFNGTEEDLPTDLEICPSCGGELHEITETRYDPAKEDA